VKQLYRQDYTDMYISPIGIKTHFCKIFFKQITAHVINKIETEKETTMNQGFSHSNSYSPETLNMLNFKIPSNKK
jgi:hypothetical protein